MAMMEASSPLAAMQHNAMLGHCGFQAGAPPSYLSMAQAKNFGQSSFNFKEMSMYRSIPKSNSDYFSHQPVRGSSPAGSLAADMSQNLSIDESSRIQNTPRRALFSRNNTFAARSNVNVTTPPIVSSSPGVHDSMELDMSPLPHKPAYSQFDLQLQLQSPTPDLTPAESFTLSLPSPPSSDAVIEPMRMQEEKKKPEPRRPSLTRAKGLSTTSIPQHHGPEVQLPPFRFGPFPSRAPQSALAEIFELSSSPVQERHPAPVPRRQFFNAPTISRNASPASQHIRKSSNPARRPTKMSRRSLSMFGNAQEVMNPDLAPPPVPSIMDVGSAYDLKLPHFVPDDQGALPRITRDTMIDVLDGKHNTKYNKMVIVDCRFEYEYEGGHIEGAVNFNDKEKLASQLFDIEPTENALLVFHCEYSAHRAPLMAKFIRNKDRTVNAERYPALTYPETYILDGGYSSFFKDHAPRCFPQSYVEMDAKEHEAACEKGMGKVKAQGRQKLMRAQTFAFGQHSPGLNSSPTAMGRSRCDDMDLDMSIDYTPAPAFRPTMAGLRIGTHRQFSY